MIPMKLSILQHTEQEPPGFFEDYTQQAGIPYEIIPLYRTMTVPPIASSHLLFLGGPMSVNQEDLYPYLVEEKRLIRSWIAEGRPVLGVCLGAQLIASACGAKVFPCTEEIGWHRVDMSGPVHVPGIPPSFTAFQLHGETFTIPPSGFRVCTGHEVENQALAVGSALGLQFHVEVTAEMIGEWTSHLPEERQSMIMEETAHQIQESSRLCKALCASFFNAPEHGHSWIGP